METEKIAKIVDRSYEMIETRVDEFSGFLQDIKELLGDISYDTSTEQDNYTKVTRLERNIEEMEGVIEKAFYELQDDMDVRNCKINR